MIYRKLGRTGLEVSEIAFGTGDNAGLLVSGTEEQQVDAVARALELGVNYFDTSPDYGKGMAEVNLGRALKKLAARPIVATKAEVHAADFGDIEGRIHKTLDESLERLGLRSVAVFMIHNMPRRQHNPGARFLPPFTVDDYLGPALRALKRARAQGKIEVFGLSAELGEAPAVKAILDSGEFGVINVSYNLANPTAAAQAPGIMCTDDYEDHGGVVDYDGILTHAGERGVGAAVIRPLAGGALTSAVVTGGVTARHALAGGMFTRIPEIFAPEARRGRAFAFLERPGRPLSHAAYAFVLSHPAVSTVIGGFSDRVQFEDLARCSGAPPLTQDELSLVQDVYRRNFDPVCA